MIISDSHKFIFFHVPKTAGQSIACKLAPYSNNRELLSPEYELHIEDISNKRYGNKETVKKIVEKIPNGGATEFYEKHRENIAWMHLAHFMFDPHHVLSENPKLNGGPVNQYLENNVEKFNEYCKFVIVRNSWDYAFSIFKNKIVVDQAAKEWNESMDWDEMIEDRINKSAFLNFMHNIQENHADIFNVYFYNRFFNLPLNQQVYFCNSEMQSYANHILFFDRMHEGLREMSDKIGIDLCGIPKCNVSGKKKNPNHYVDFYDEKSKKLVEDIFKLDIERFNFKFGE